MVIKGKALSRRTSEESFMTSHLAKESAMNKITETLISRRLNAINKQRMPNSSLSVWDFDTETPQVQSKSLRKSTEDDLTPKGIVGVPSNYVINTSERLLDAKQTKISRNEVTVNQPAPRITSKDEPGILDKLFPDISTPNYAAFVPKNDSRATNQPTKQLLNYVERQTTETNSRFLSNQVSQAKKTSERSMEVKALNNFSNNSNFKGVCASPVDVKDSFSRERKTRLINRLFVCALNELSLTRSSISLDTSFEKGEPTMNNQVRYGSSKPLPKSTVKGKSFEEWSRERLLLPNKSLLPKENLQPPSAMETESLPVVKPITKELVEIETDYFYGVRSDDFDIYDSNNCEYIPVKEGFSESSEHDTGLIGEKSLCRVSEFIKKFAEDATDPISHEFHDILEKMEEQGSYGAKRKSSATHLSPRGKSYSKRNRHNSKPNYQSRYSKDALATSEEFISIQVSDVKEDLKLLVLGMEIYELKENFPWIFHLIPMVDLEQITLPCSACAMIIVLRSVFQVKYTFPSWDVVVEIYGLAKEYGIQKLVEECKIYFEDNPIATADIKKITELVRQLGVEEILQYASTFQISERPTFQNPDVFESKSCIISCTMDKESNEFSVPLFPSPKGDLGSIRKTDIQNEIEVESFQGFHTITGVQIKFELDSSDKGKQGIVFCDISKGRERMLEMEKDIEIQTNVVINFSKKIALGPKESVRVVLLIEEIKSSWCHCLREEKAEYGGESGILRVRYKSRNKTSSKHSLFFIDKVFYQ